MLTIIIDPPCYAIQMRSDLQYLIFILPSHPPSRKSYEKLCRSPYILIPDIMVSYVLSTIFLAAFLAAVPMNNIGNEIDIDMMKRGVCKIQLYKTQSLDTLYY